VERLHGGIVARMAFVFPPYIRRSKIYSKCILFYIY
jgi:hypothetical protein